MAGGEATKGIQTRRRMNPNLTVATPEAPRTGEPEESLAPAAAAYSPSNTLSVPEEHQMLDPIVYSWLDDSSAAGEEYTHAPEPAPVDGPNVLEGDDLLVARSVRPSRLAAATGIETVNTSTLEWSTQGAAAAAALEVGAPELRFQMAIQIHQHHNIVRPGSSANRNQEAASADAVSLARAIQHTHSSLEAAKGANPDGGNNSSFECNICLELARQPVVTSCGHLFCWSCLYQWLHAQSDFSECPVCKGEVLKADITPIYGRGGGEEGESSTANPNLPSRPQAHRRENLRQLLQMAGNAREMARVLRQLIRNQSMNWEARVLPSPATTSVPAARQRAGARRQQRQDNSASRSIHSAVPNVGNVASEGSNQNQLPNSNGDNSAQVVLAAPQQSSISPVEYLSTSSTPAAVVDEPGPSRQSRRPSESPTIRRTRRRPQ